MTEEKKIEKKPGVLNEHEIEQFKNLLYNSRLQREDVEIKLKEQEKSLDNNLPTLVAQENLEAMKKELAEGKTKDGTELREADKIIVQIQIDSLEEEIKRDLPKRRLREEIRKNQGRLNQLISSINHVERTFKKQGVAY